MALPSNKKTYLFIVTSFWAYGELTIAINLAKMLLKTAYRVVFLIPPSHEKRILDLQIPYRILIPNTKQLNKGQLKEISITFEPCVCILADLLNYLFCERHYNLTINDLSVFEGRIAALDLYDFAKSNGRVDTYGFLSKNMKDISVDAFPALLQPCPVLQLNKNSSGKETNSRIIKYKLFENIKMRTNDEYVAARRKLGISDNKKVILITSAIWQHKNRCYPGALMFIEKCKYVLEQSLKKLGKDVLIISIGAQDLFVNETFGQFRHYNELSSTDFQDVSNACNLYLSNNYISTSMIELVLRGVPVLLYRNSFLKRNNEAKWVTNGSNECPTILNDTLVAYPFLMFPVGWYRFLKHVYSGNDFYKLMSHMELFKSDAVDRIHDKLFVDKSGHESAILNYQIKLNDLESPSEILTSIFQ